MITFRSLPAPFFFPPSLSSSSLSFLPLYPSPFPPTDADERRKDCGRVQSKRRIRAPSRVGSQRRIPWTMSFHANLETHSLCRTLLYVKNFRFAHCLSAFFEFGLRVLSLLPLSLCVFLGGYILFGGKRAWWTDCLSLLSFSVTWVLKAPSVKKWFSPRSFPQQN